MARPSTRSQRQRRGNDEENPENTQPQGSQNAAVPTPNDQLTAMQNLTAAIQALLTVLPFGTPTPAPVANVVPNETQRAGSSSQTPQQTPTTVNPTPEAVPTQPMIHPKQAALTLFFKPHVPTFDGTGTEMDADYWFDAIRKQLKLTATPAEFWVEFASNKLVGLASTWWASIEDGLTEE